MPTAGADSLRKSLRVLELVTSRRPLWSGAEVAKALDLPASTAHRILQAWCEAGYLVRDESSRYGLGYSAVRLGENALATYDARRLARPALESITARTGETSLFAVHDEMADRAVIADFVESPQSLKVTLPVKHEVPLDGGSISRVHDAAFRSGGTRIDDVLRDGYAFAYEETREGTWGVAAPLRDLAGNVVGILSVLAPTLRFDEERKATAIAAVLAFSRATD